MSRPTLRACPMCKTADEEQICFYKHVVVYGPKEDDEYTAYYSIQCHGCGVEVSDEYSDEAIRLWNGEDKKEDEE